MNVCQSARVTSFYEPIYLQTSPALGNRERCACLRACILNSRWTTVGNLAGWTWNTDMAENKVYYNQSNKEHVNMHCSKCGFCVTFMRDEPSSSLKRRRGFSRRRHYE
jgi:hypothetical protein